MSARVACRTPAAGRNGVTNIPLWKFEALREAILAVLAEGDLMQAELTGQVDALLSTETKAELGKLGWHVVTVRLELEVRGEVRRKSERPVVIGLA